MLLKMSDQVGEPPESLFAAMDETIKDLEKTTKIIDTNGLRPTADAATRIRVTDGSTTVLDGPFAESRELVGGYALVEVDSYEQAVEAARKIIQVHTDHWPTWEGEAEVRQVMG
jgi:hypothetical protein